MTDDTALPPPPPPQVIRPIDPEQDMRENKDIAALSYLWILCLVVLWGKRESPFVQFHAKQGTVLFLLSIVFWFVPFINQLLELLILVACALGFIAAAQGQRREMPFVTALARRDWHGVRKDWQWIVNWVNKMWNSKAKSAPQTPPNPPQPAASHPQPPTPPAPPTPPTV